MANSYCQRELEQEINRLRAENLALQQQLMRDSVERRARDQETQALLYENAALREELVVTEGHRQYLLSTSQQSQELVNLYWEAADQAILERDQALTQRNMAETARTNLQTRYLGLVNMLDGIRRDMNEMVRRTTTLLWTSLLTVFIPLGLVAALIADRQVERDEEAAAARPCVHVPPAAAAAAPAGVLLLASLRRDSGYSCSFGCASFIVTVLFSIYEWRHENLFGKLKCIGEMLLGGFAAFTSLAYYMHTTFPLISFWSDVVSRMERFQNFHVGHIISTLSMMALLYRINTVIHHARTRARLRHRIQEIERQAAPHMPEQHAV